MQIKLDKNTEYLISKLVSAGFSAHAVGGAVRDSLLGREVSDFDIASSALPEETKKVFSSQSVIETGIKHGTVTVVLDHKPYEITTYRVESQYSDSRHPDSVSFVRCLNEDLARRDFTVNALAFSPQDGLIDLFGGAEDIKNRIIRAVGDPAKRFSEDALRILRAIRFASVLGFSIEENTSNALLALSETLSSVSPERILTELKKTLCGENAQAVVNNYLPVLEQVLTVSGSPKSLSLLPPDFAMRLTCLCGKGVIESLSRLRADNETKRICKLLVESKPIPSTLPALKQYISSLGEENSLLVASYRRALFCEDNEKQTEKLLSSGECLFLKDLAVKGFDLISLGIKGKDIGKVLNALLNSVLLGEVENEKEKLIELVKNAVL